MGYGLVKPEHRAPCGCWTKCSDPRQVCRKRFSRVDVGPAKPCTLLRYMLGSEQVRAGFAEKTVLRAWLLSYSVLRSAAWLQFSRIWFLSSMLGSAQVRVGFAEKTLLRAVS